METFSFFLDESFNRLLDSRRIFYLFGDLRDKKTDVDALLAKHEEFSTAKS
jgi:hypothetical protein